MEIIRIFAPLTINKKLNEATKMAEKDKMLWEAIDALDRKLDASNYKKDSQLLLMNRQHGNAAIHQLFADSCYNDCMKYRTKYGKEVAE